MGSLTWVRVRASAGAFGLALVLCAVGCVMSGYDRKPLPSDVSPPRAGSGAAGGKAGASGEAGEGGAGSGTMASAGRGGSTPPKPAVDPCAGKKDGAACDDGLTCTENERCAGGRCEGDAVVCPAPTFGDEANNDCRKRECVEPAGCSDVPKPDLTACGLNADVANCVGGQCTNAVECDDTICSPICTSQTCLFTCPEALLCQPSCIGNAQGGSVCYFDCRGAADCEAGCANDSWCTIDCRGVDDCNGTCRIGTTCVFNCTDTPECDDIVCEAGAQCAVHCTEGQRCAFKLCENGELSCGENVIGCGGCPPPSW